jgi:hypothetical protein
VAQYARPDADISNTGWVQSTGSTLYECLDEVSYSDADYITSDTVSESCMLRLSDVTDPASSTGHVIRLRATATGTATAEKLTYRLYQGGTLIGGVTGASIARNTYNEYTYTLLAAEADAITDYTDLRLQFQVTTLAAGETISISWACLEVPSTALVLALDAGSYATTGQDPALAATRKLSLDAGSYALTGNDPALAVARAIALDAGSYGITGLDATLTYTPVGGYSLSCDAGSYAITGRDPTLAVARKLALDTGGYAVTGRDATLAAARKVVLDAGTYTVTGRDLALTLARALALDAGSYVVTGRDLALAVARAIALGMGSYIVTGQDPTLTVEAVAPPPSSTYTMPPLAGITGMLLAGAVLTGMFKRATSGYALAGHYASRLAAASELGVFGRALARGVVAGEVGLELAEAVDAGHYAPPRPGSPDVGNLGEE